MKSYQMMFKNVNLTLNPHSDLPFTSALTFKAIKYDLRGRSRFYYKFSTESDQKQYMLPILKSCEKYMKSICIRVNAFYLISRSLT